MEKEREVLRFARRSTALGHLDDPRAVPLVRVFCSDPRVEIRFSVAFALGLFPNDPLSVKTLAYTDRRR